MSRLSGRFNTPDGLRRLHLFEFGDQPWFPQVLRDAETAYLTVAYRLFPLPRLWAEKISTVLRRGEPCEILDLCSGSGGAIPSILKELEMLGFEARARLTDLYPNLTPPSHSNVLWETEPVDATNVSPALTGVRTMFSAFHHFRPDAARAILRSAFDRGRAICIFESGPGTLLGIATMFLVPINVLALMPFARPFRWGYLVFTYLIPVMPLIVFWDGIVSMLRIYSPEQMKAMTGDLERSDYCWEIGLIQVRGIPGGRWCAKCALIAILAISVGVFVVRVARRSKVIECRVVASAEYHPAHESQFVAVVYPSKHVQLKFAGTGIACVRDLVDGRRISREFALYSRAGLNDRSRCGKDASGGSVVWPYHREALRFRRVVNTPVAVSDSGCAGPGIGQRHGSADSVPWREDGLVGAPVYRPFSTIRLAYHNVANDQARSLSEHQRLMGQSGGSLAVRKTLINDVSLAPEYQHLESPDYNQEESEREHRPICAIFLAAIVLVAVAVGYGGSELIGLGLAVRARRRLTGIWLEFLGFSVVLLDFGAAGFGGWLLVWRGLCALSR
jgi:hypothetical protein